MGITFGIPFKLKPYPEVPELYQAIRGRWFGRIGSGLLYRVRVHGRHLVPKSGPVLFACNHTSYIDGPLLVATSPRPLHVLVKQEMFSGFWSKVLPWAGQIPIDRSNGRAGLSTALKVLKAGGAVGVFPEGTRGNGEVGEAHGGVAWLAIASNAVVVPVAVLGARYSYEKVSRFTPPGRRIRVVYGKPMQFDVTLKGREGIAQATEMIRARLASHVQAASDFTGFALPNDATPAT